jgi:alkyldihydroxyacetonephosphate synthase
MTIDRVIAELIQALGREIVITDPADLDRTSHDSWPMSTVLAKLGRHAYRPDVVVYPQSSEDVRRVAKIAHRLRAPLTARGLGSSVTGQPLPLEGGIVIDLSRLVSTPVLERRDGYVTVAAGVCGGDLERWLNERGMTLNHFPQSLGRSTVGGWLATRATGQFSSRYGGIEDLVVGYQVVLADGTQVELVQRPRASMGPDLRSIFLGSEGTLGLITKVSLKVFRRPEDRIVEAFAVPTISAGLSIAQEVVQVGLRPMIVRLYDADEARHALGEAAPDLPVLFLGHEGIKEVAEAEHREAVHIAMGCDARSLGPSPVEEWLARRYDFSTIEKLVSQPGGYAETIEVANFWSRVEPMYAELKQALAPLADEVLGHFSHVYSSGTSVYLIILGTAPDDYSALSRMQAIWKAAMDVTTRHGGELSHHHGAGLARLPYIEESLGAGFQVLTRIKQSLDPHGTLNPGKLSLRAPGNRDVPGVS